MRVVVKEIGKLGEIREIENDLSTFQEIVGGNIETFRMTDDIIIVLNDEGKIEELQPNIGVPCHNNQTEVIVGNIFFVGVDGCDFASLKDEHLDFLRKLGILPSKTMAMDFYPLANHLKDKSKVIVDTGRCKKEE